MNTQRDIKNTYYDALFFASSNNNNKKEFYLRGVEFRLLLKLIHYSMKQENINWSSENIAKHLIMSVDAVNKSIQRLRQKGWINVINKQRSATNRTRTIFINWEFILEIDSLYSEFINSDKSEQYKPEMKHSSEVIKETSSVYKEEIIENESTENYDDDDDDDDEKEKPRSLASKFIEELNKLTPEQFKEIKN